MSHVDDYYDFHIGGHDARLIKIAIKNDIYHTITVRANVAKTIDFSGDTRKVETIRLSKCFKATRIIWPERTGAIRRLYIHNADTLTKLDLTELTSLEELSILECRSLEEIIGLSDSIKEINIHNVKLKNLNLTHLLKLQKINVATNCSEINLDAGGLDQLQIAMVITKKTMTDKTDHSKLNFKGCTSLHTLYIDTGENPVTLDANACAGLKEDAILTGRGSEVIGLQEKRVTKDPSVLLKLSQDYYGITRLSKPGIHDRETIIQESGSQVEVDRASGTKITLLGMPIDVRVENSQKDLSKELRAFLIDNTYLPTTTFPAIYYLPELPFVKLSQYGIPASRVVTKQNPAKTIAAWELNEEGMVPNMLMINEEALKFPVVINFLQHLDTRKTKTVIDHREHPLQPFNKVVVAGVDWYDFKNRFPYLASKIVRVPPAAFLARGAGGVLGLTPEAIGIYQSMLQDASNFLAKSMLQDDKTLSHRNRNLQILKQAAELRKISQAYFNMLTRITGVIKNNDFIPQRNVDYKPYDGQAPVGGESKHRNLPDDGQTGFDAKADAVTPPDMQGKKALQEPINTPPDMKGKKAPQEPINTPPDMKGKKAPQEPINTPPDMQGKKALQEPINTPPDMKGRKAPQEPINTPPDMKGKKAPQEPINTPPDMQGKKALQERFDGPPDPFEPRTAPQVPFSGKATAKGLDDVPPLEAEPTNQVLMNTARKLANDIKHMTDNVEGLPEQVFVQAESSHRETNPASELRLLEASRNLASALKKMTESACVINSEKSSASSHAAAVLVDAAIRDLQKDQTKVSVYDAAQDLIVAIKLLAKACSEELSQEEKEKLVQDYSSEKKTIILNILISARDQYIVDHRLLTPGLGQFGRIPGKEDVKGEILSRFIDALSNNEVLSEELTDKEMKKLMGSEKKPSELSYALLGIKEEMRECLTGVKRPEPKPSPRLKDEL